MDIWSRNTLPSPPSERWPLLLNQTAEYALRAMAVLANCWPEGRLTSSELAAEGNVPGHYVSKVMRRLVLAGLVDAQRGHRGGFRLSRAPSEISFMEVLEAVDFQTEEKRCAFGLGKCTPASPCTLHPAYSVLSDYFIGWARSTTLMSATSSEPLPPRDATVR